MTSWWQDRNSGLYGAPVPVVGTQDKMSDKPEEPLKKAAKEWAKSYWLITPWNLLGFGCSLELTKLLFGLVGTSGYATVSRSLLPRFSLR